MVFPIAVELRATASSCLLIYKATGSDPDGRPNTEEARELSPALLTRQLL